MSIAIECRGRLAEVDDLGSFEMVSNTWDYPPFPPPHNYICFPSFLENIQPPKMALSPEGGGGGETIQQSKLSRLSR